MLAKGQLLILTNSLYGKRPRFCSHVTDFFASPVLYPICLPSRLDSLLCGVNPCALPPLFLQFSLSPLPHSPPVSRQDGSTGSIHGTVFDPSIRRIAGASVALVNTATGFRYQQPTNGQGQFAFELLPPGNTPRVTSEAMSPQLSQTLHVDIGGVTDIAFQMTLAGWRLEFTAESFNLFNRLNRRYQITDDGLMSNQAQFNFGTKRLGINYFPAYYQVPTNFMKATSAYAPRQLQFAMRLGF